MRIAARMATQRGLGLFAAETRGVQSSRATVEAGQPRWWLGMCSGSTSEQPDRLARGTRAGTSRPAARPATRFWGVNRGQKGLLRKTLTGSYISSLGCITTRKAQAGSTLGVDGSDSSMLSSNMNQIPVRVCGDRSPSLICEADASSERRRPREPRRHSSSGIAG